MKEPKLYSFSLAYTALMVRKVQKNNLFTHFVLKNPLSLTAYTVEGHGGAGAQLTLGERRGSP